MASSHGSKKGSGQEHAPALVEDLGFSSDTTIEEQNDDDMLWTVEDVLAEMPMEEHGEPHYLILWTGFPLHEASWEPKEHLEPDTLKAWAENKAAVEKGEKEPFDVESWFNSKVQYLKERIGRAELRNARRIALGRPLTPTLQELQRQLKEVATQGDIDVTDFETDGLLSDSDDSYSDEIDERILSRPRPVAEKDPEKAALPPKGRVKPDSPNTPDAPPGTSQREDPSRLIQSSGADGAPQSRPKAPHRDSGSTKQAPAPGKQEALLRRSVSKVSGSSATTTRANVATPARVRSLLPSGHPSKNSRIVSGASGPTSRNPAAPQQTPSSSQGSSRLAARRTTVAKGSLGAGANIFVTGIVRKQRRRLKDALVDPTKGQKHFTKMRIQNIAFKRIRDGSDRAPDNLPSGLFRITDTAQHSKSIQKPESESESRESGRKSASKSTHESAESADGGPEPRKKQKKKSVRFAEIESVAHGPSEPIMDAPYTAEPAGMDDEEAVFIPRNSPPPPVHQTTRITKMISIGGSGLDALEVLFDGIPDMPAEDWYVHLTGGGPIHFTHFLTPQDLAAQMPDLIGANLASGCVTTEKASNALKTLSKQLETGSRGVVCEYEKYIIILYPNGCDMWKDPIFKASSNTTPECLIRHLMYAKRVEGDQMLSLCGDVSEALAENDDSVSGHAVFEHILGREYSSLLPTAMKNTETEKVEEKTDGKETEKSAKPNAVGQGSIEKAQHAFFLVASPTEDNILRELSICLKLRDPDSRIYLSSVPGAWKAMCRSTSVGTIIFHEPSMYIVRRMPGIWDMLRRGDHCFTFWSFSGTMLLRPGPNPTDSTKPGMVATGAGATLSRIFPGGRAILVTPSFLLTQPRRAYELLKWYTTKVLGRQSRFTKLVLASDAEQYVRDIASQRALQSAETSGVVPIFEGKLDENCAVWFKLLEKLGHLVSEATDEAGLMDECLSPVIFAPESIVSNDEQSLVDWFAWWSLTVAEEYRRFVVIGTNEEDIQGENGCKMMARFPNYRLDLVLDSSWPDDLAMESNADATGRVLQKSFPFPSRLLKTDSSQSITDYVEGLIRRGSSFLIMYKFPVGFHDSCLDYSGSRGVKHYTFTAWFDYLRPFDPSGRKCVYGGLFYTAVRGWDTVRSGQRPTEFLPQLPWLAFYRPSNPHKFVSGEKIDGSDEVDLIIWDFFAIVRFPLGQQPTENALSDAQQDLIRFVRQETSRKNAGSRLGAVWLGGFPLDPLIDADLHPMDATLEFLGSVLTNLKKEVPATSQQLERSGYRRVILDVESPASWASTEEEKPPQGHPAIVFPPPPGDRTGDPSPYNNNILYGAASEARKRGFTQDDSAFPFRFEPTMRWYKDQCKEGRGYAHILVAPWQEGFEILGIQSQNGEPQES